MTLIKTTAFDYSIRRSKRAKRTRILVTPEKVEVVAPLRVSCKQIDDFVTLKQDWVLSTVKKLKQKKQQIKKWVPDRLVEGVLIPFKGELIKIKLNRTATLKKILIELSGKHFIIHQPYNTLGSDSDELVRQALVDWMKQQAKRQVEAIVLEYAHKYNLYPRFIRIKVQKSRWGSCGIHNDINLNWVLILAPKKVLEYVVIHEICHIKERNHSAKFWALVERHCPDYQTQRDWLTQNGQSLMLGL